MPTKRFVAGFYRVTMDNTECFGNVKKEGSEWLADIRNRNGDLIRYAGIWSSKKDAVEEVEFILEKM